MRGGHKMRLLENALTELAGCAVVISHDCFFLDRLCTHIIAFEGEARVECFAGDFDAYEEDKIRRLRPDAVAEQGDLLLGEGAISWFTLRTMNDKKP